MLGKARWGGVDGEVAGWWWTRPDDESSLSLQRDASTAQSAMSSSNCGGGYGGVAVADCTLSGAAGCMRESIFRPRSRRARCVPAVVQWHARSEARLRN
jgi:hypothetical protein